MCLPAILGTGLTNLCRWPPLEKAELVHGSLAAFPIHVSVVQIVDADLALLTADTGNGPVVRDVAVQAEGGDCGTTLELAVEGEALLHGHLDAILLDDVDEDLAVDQSQTHDGVLALISFNIVSRYSVYLLDLVQVPYLPSSLQLFELLVLLLGLPDLWVPPDFLPSSLSSTLFVLEIAGHKVWCYLDGLL